MHTGGRESELLIALAQTRNELARVRELHESTENARCVLLAELRAANARADRAEAEVRAISNDADRLIRQEKEALAAARRECEDADGEARILRALLSEDRTQLAAERDAARKALEELPRSVKLIAAERKRQIEKEGWTPEHDDEHPDGSLALAAASYALPESAREALDAYRAHWPHVRADVPLTWPASWHHSWWKPSPDNRTRELVKAGALIVAEIDRLNRSALAAPAAASGEEERIEADFERLRDVPTMPPDFEDRE